MESRQETATAERALVCVVDDDESVRESLPDLLKEFGFEVGAFSSTQEFLASDSLNRAGCLILDIAMPGMTGLDLQRELQVRGEKIPIIFITAQTDGALRARAFEGGAVGFLLKPFSDTALLCVSQIRASNEVRDPLLYRDWQGATMCRGEEHKCAWSKSNNRKPDCGK